MASLLVTKGIATRGSWPYYYSNKKATSNKDAMKWHQLHMLQDSHRLRMASVALVDSRSSDRPMRSWAAWLWVKFTLFLHVPSKMGLN